MPQDKQEEADVTAALTRQQVVGDADPLLNCAGRQMEDDLRAKRENAARSAGAPLKEGAAVRESGLQNAPGGCGLDFHGVGRHSLPPTQLA
jgi:hypothetical protein